MANTAELKKEMKITVRCKVCNHRIFDKITPATGIIEIKCPECHQITKVDLSFRRIVKYRRTVAIGLACTHARV